MRGDHEDTGIVRKPVGVCGIVPHLSRAEYMGRYLVAQEGKVKQLNKPISCTVRYLLAFVLLISLGGCVAVPNGARVIYPLQGEVYLNGVLHSPAIVEVVVVSVLEGRALPVVATRYEVTMLPLAFAMRLTPLQWGQGELYVRTRLRFVGSAAVQANAQQKAFKVLNGSSMTIALQPRVCYPHCQ